MAAPWERDWSGGGTTPPVMSPPWEKDWSSQAGTPSQFAIAPIDEDSGGLPGGAMLVQPPAIETKPTSAERAAYSDERLDDLGFTTPELKQQWRDAQKRSSFAEWNLGTPEGAAAKTDELSFGNVGRQVMSRFGRTGTGLLEVAGAITGSDTLKSLAQTDVGWGAQQMGDAKAAYDSLKNGNYLDAFTEYAKVAMDIVPGELAQLPLYMTGAGSIGRGARLAKEGVKSFGKKGGLAGRAGRAAKDLAAAATTARGAAHMGVATGTYLSLTGMLAQERAEKQGRPGEITGEDWVYAGTGAAASYLSEKLGVDFLRKLGGGKVLEKLTPEMAADVKGIMGAAAKAAVATKKHRLGRAAIGAGAEATQEFVQEGLIESLATSYGTKDWESKDLEARIDDMLMQGLAGAVAGGTIGGGVGLVSRSPYAAEQAAIEARETAEKQAIPTGPVTPETQVNEGGIVGPTEAQYQQGVAREQAQAATREEQRLAGLEAFQQSVLGEAEAAGAFTPAIVAPDTRAAEAAALQARGEPTARISAPAPAASCTARPSPRRTADTPCAARPRRPSSQTRDPP